MEERQHTKKKRAERVLLLLTLLLAAFTLFHVFVQPPQPLILETIPETTAVPSQLLDLNRATAEELESLPGIGPILAQRILESGPFNGPEDVLAVPGIGEATYEKFSPYITFK